MLLNVPVKPHIKEFFLCEELFGVGPIPVRRNHYIGEMIAAIFGHYPLQSVDQQDLAPTDKGRTAELQLDLTFPINAGLITDYHLLQLGTVLEVVFQTYAMGFVSGRMDIFASLNGASNRFAQVHKLSPDSFSPDSIRKVVTRNRAKKKAQPAATA